MIYLSPPFDSEWKGKTPFAEASKLQGAIYREVKSRRTLRFELQGKPYFAKIHFGIGWREIIKDLVQLRLPILGAKNEWDAIKKLRELDIDTMTVKACGIQGFNPAQIRSFIITEELTGTITLEDYCERWPQSPPDYKEKQALLTTLANVSRVMHRAGMCHRDYYLCHFHLHQESIGTGSPKVSLIDLHRALISNNLSTRWVIKDIAGLYFSAMDIGLSKRDLYRFMTTYTGDSLRQCLSGSDGFWRSVSQRAIKLYDKEQAVKGLD